MEKNHQLRHLGLIMDGNRRWAKQHGKSTIEGHREGYKALKQLLKTVDKLGIETVSVYSFSTDNWKRDKDEVKGLFKLLRWVLKNELNELIEQGIKIVWLGSRDNLSSELIDLLRKTEEKTKDLKVATLAICFNYGGRQEIVDSVNKVMSQGQVVSEQSITDNLYHPEIPPIDLLIRTSGEQRLSNYMTWRTVYSELAFTDTLWPDFKGPELSLIVDDFITRNRRLGA